MGTYGIFYVFGNFFNINSLYLKERIIENAEDESIFYKYFYANEKDIIYLLRACVYLRIV